MTPFSPIERDRAKAAVLAVEYDYDAAWSAGDLVKFLPFFYTPRDPQ